MYWLNMQGIKKTQQFREHVWYCEESLWIFGF